MTERKVQIVMSLKDRMSTRLAAMEGRLKKFEMAGKAAMARVGVAAKLAGMALTKLGHTLRWLYGRMRMAATIGLGALIAALTFAEKKAIDQTKAEAKLQAVLDATGNAAGWSATQLFKQASALQKLTGVGDETIIAGQGILATFRQINGEAFKETMELALDMSAVLDQDLRQTLIQVGKAVNDPLIGFTALRRVGVSFTEEQQKQIANFMKVNDVASAQRVILDELQIEFGGAAEKMHQATGAFRAIWNAVGDATEAFGQGLYPTFNKASKSITAWVEDNQDRFAKWGITVGEYVEYVAEVIGDFFAETDSWSQRWGVLWDAMVEAIKTAAPALAGAALATGRVVGQGIKRGIMGGSSRAVYDEAEAMFRRQYGRDPSQDGRIVTSSGTETLGTYKRHYSEAPMHIEGGPDGRNQWVSDDELVRRLVTELEGRRLANELLPELEGSFREVNAALREIGKDTAESLAPGTAQERARQRDADIEARVRQYMAEQDARRNASDMPTPPPPKPEVDQQHVMIDLTEEAKSLIRVVADPKGDMLEAMAAGGYYE